MENSQKSKAYSIWIFIVCSLLGIGYLYAQRVWLLSVVQIQKDLVVSDIFSRHYYILYFVGSFVGFFFGFLSDKRGRKLVLLIALAVACATSALCSILQTHWLIVINIFLFSAAFAIIIPTSYGIIKDTFTEKLSAIYGGVALVVVFFYPTSFFMAGYIDSHYGWQATFQAISLIAFILFLICLTTPFKKKAIKEQINVGQHIKLFLNFFQYEKIRAPVLFILSLNIPMGYWSSAIPFFFVKELKLSEFNAGCILSICAVVAISIRFIFVCCLWLLPQKTFKSYYVIFLISAIITVIGSIGLLYSVHHLTVWNLAAPAIFFLSGYYLAMMNLKGLIVFYYPADTAELLGFFSSYQVLAFMVGSIIHLAAYFNYVIIYGWTVFIFALLGLIIMLNVRLNKN